MRRAPVCQCRRLRRLSPVVYDFLLSYVLEVRLVFLLSYVIEVRGSEIRPWAREGGGLRKNTRTTFETLELFCFLFAVKLCIRSSRLGNRNLGRGRGGGEQKAPDRFLRRYV